MAIRYPGGRLFHESDHSAKKKSVSSQVIYGNRGMSLEQEINASNQYYLTHGIAVVHKKPIPVQIVDVNYPKRSAAVVKEAYFKTPSTTDYNGVYKGKYIDFEAKETKNKTSFPLKNFHEHQVQHMRACVAQGGICFTIIKFTQTQEIFLLPARVLFDYWQQQATGRKSIPKQAIIQAGYAIQYHINPTVPYLDAVDKFMATIQ